GPNPVRVGGRLSIRSAAGTAALYDAFGRKLAEQKVSGNTVWQLDGLSAGSYVLRLTVGGTAVNRPLVVCR
ncbi:MAG: T9SS type A sorting domain-containing protein, partial [candidate division WOR-3 bacterium]